MKLLHQREGEAAEKKREVDDAAGREKEEEDVAVKNRVEEAVKTGVAQRIY